MPISLNIQKIKKAIPAHVELIAVSKTKPNHMLLEAYEVGQRHFGENYVQELLEKHEHLPKDICWHFIGHLQSNKVKYIAPFVHLIHSVDSFKLLQEINKQAQKNNRVIHCLLQVYIAQEETKFGFDENECVQMLESDAYKQLKHICIDGLMGMASNTDNEVQLKQEFLSIKSLFNKLKASPLVTADFKHLSIGMSSDYQLAINCGSTMIRVGSSIFGQRDYTNNH